MRAGLTLSPKTTKNLGKVHIVISFQKFDFRWQRTVITDRREEKQVSLTLPHLWGNAFSPVPCELWVFPLWLKGKQIILSLLCAPGIMHVYPFGWVFPDSWVVSSHTWAAQQSGPLACLQSPFSMQIFSLVLRFVTSRHPDFLRSTSTSSPQWICWDLLGFTLLMIQSKNSL